MLTNRNFSNFDLAARAVLDFLHKRLGFDLWMVTRTIGDDWVVLQAEDHGYGVNEGAVFRWADSFCSQMVLGRGPCIAPRSSDVPAYASAPIGQLVTIGAYVGVPLRRNDGTLFGTLCAIHPTPQPDSISAEYTLIDLLARLLCTVLESDLRASEDQRRADLAQAEALTDSLTGLANRRGWDQLLATEEGRCRRFGHPSCILSIDLNELKRVNDTEGHAKGDDLLRQAAGAIRGAVRDQDFVARVGGDEFLVLGIECEAAGAMSLCHRVKEALEEARVSASVGLALLEPRQGLSAAVDQADRAMYACKQEQKQEAHSRELVPPLTL